MLLGYSDKPVSELLDWYCYFAGFIAFESCFFYLFCLFVLIS